MKRLALVVLAVAAALFGAEALLRLLGLPRQRYDFLGPETTLTDVFRTDPELFWRLRPDNPRYRTNELGLRGWLPRGAKRASDLRIACVGDSCTFGYGVPYEEVWGVQLERMLQRRRPDLRVESVLAGLPGYSTHQNRLLFEQKIAPLAPDVTVLYCGAWNDYLVAVGPADADRVAGAFDSRLAAVLRNLRAPELADYRAAFERGEPWPVRVPLADFEANIRAIVARARAAGSAVMMIVPPIPAATAARYPAGAPYRNRVRELAAELGAGCVDGERLLGDAEAALANGWRTPPTDTSPCFHDWIHPSIFGHRLLAAAVVDLVAASGVLDRRAAAPSPRPVVRAAEPAAVDALAGGEVELRGEHLEFVDRVWLGPCWLADLSRRGEALLVRVPPLTATGNWPVELVGAAGSVVGEVRIAVRAPSLEVEIRRAGGNASVHVAGLAPPSGQAVVWLAPARRREPAATRFGWFGLATPADGRPPGMPLAPFRFDMTGLPSLPIATAGDDGRFRIDVQVPPEEQARLPARVFLQAALLTADAAQIVLTDVVVAEVPR